MRNVELLRLEADTAYKELLESIEGVSEELSWAVVPLQPGEYLHAEGSIISTVLHITGSKFVYGSVAYRNHEVRWRDVVARFEAFWPNWEATKAFLKEGHEYWMSTWSEEDDVERLVKNFRDQDRPSWQIISMMSHHDTYHAGQIQVLRSALPPTSTPPIDEGDLWRKYCGDLPSW